MLIPSPPWRAFSFLEQPFLGGGDRFGVAEQDDDVAFLKAGFRRRFDGADAAAADGADLAAQVVVQVEFVEGAADGPGPRAQMYRVQARLMMVFDVVAVMVAGAPVEATQQAVALRARLADALEDAIEGDADCLLYTSDAADE